MKLLPLILANLARRKVRTALTLGSFAAALFLFGLLGNQPRQVDANRRPLPLLRIDFEMASGLLDEPVDHGEAEARALADLLGGEEGLDRAGQGVRVHSAACIGHADRDILAR